MDLKKSDRGFEYMLHYTYLPENREHDRLASQSSAFGDYEDSFQRPGSSYLWVGKYHHLNREQVREFASRLLAWCETGSLNLSVECKETTP